MDSQSLVYIAARNNCMGQQNIRRLKRHKSYNIKRFSHLPCRIVVKTNSRYPWFITRVEASPNDIPNLKKQILELFSQNCTDDAYIKYVTSVTKTTIYWCCKKFFWDFKLPFSFLLLDTRGNRLIINETIPLVFVGNGGGAKCVTSVTLVTSVTFVTSVTMINQTK